jgi:threonine dehydrogenase-like Zn-dependent dehydrogenase
MGGVDALFDWVGSTQSISDSLRLVKAGGHMVLGGIGLPKNVDWTPLWAQECTIHGSASHATEDFQGARISTFELAIRLLRERKPDLEPLLTHTFPLKGYRDAFNTILRKRHTHAIRVAFKYPDPKP